MKKFFVDLYEMVWLNELEWLKIHWKGYIVLIVVAAAIGLVPEFISQRLEDKKHREFISDLNRKYGIKETEAE